MALTPPLIPILREGIEVIKMVLFQELKSLSLLRERNATDVNLLTAAVVNDLFNVKPSETVSETASTVNREVVEEIYLRITKDLDHLRIPLTDALRIQYFCDRHEGVDSVSVLERAEKQGILIATREVPLPGAFLSIVRSFGRAYGILEPLPLTVSETPQMNQNGVNDG
jgi:hypothetical protein